MIQAPPLIIFFHPEAHDLAEYEEKNQGDNNCISACSDYADQLDPELLYVAANQAGCHWGWREGL